MTQFLPPNLLALFQAREPPIWKPPVDKLLVDRKRARMSGIAQYVRLFEEKTEVRIEEKRETAEERKDRRRREKAELHAYKIEQGIALWNPAENPNATTDPYRTIFVGRINYETSESKLRREMESYGSVKKVKLVMRKDGKPRGYAFVEFEKERDMHEAYKKADGKKIDNRRVLVDVERGRAVKGWLPRRLGGGLGSSRRAREKRTDDDDRDRRRDSRESSSTRDRVSERRRSRSPPRSEGRSADRDRGDRDKDRHRSDRDRGADRERKESRSSKPERDRGGGGGGDRGGDRGGGGGGGGEDRGGDRDRRRRDDRRSDVAAVPQNNNGHEMMN